MGTHLREREKDAARPFIIRGLLKGKIKMASTSPAQLAAQMLGSLARVGAFVGVGATAVASAIYDVDGGERAVMFDRFRGVLETTSGEGTHFMVPVIQSPTIYDVRTRPKSLSSVTGTEDLQQVNLTLRVLCRPNVEKLSSIHLNLGPDYDDRVLPSIADELLTRRQEVTEQIAKSLRIRAEDFGILLEDVALTHLSFSHEYSRAIEAKQVAQQDAERAKFVVMKSEQEREAAVIRAEGESESAKLISQAT